MSPPGDDPGIAPDGPASTNTSRLSSRAVRQGVCTQMASPCPTSMMWMRSSSFGNVVAALALHRGPSVRVLSASECSRLRYVRSPIRCLSAPLPADVPTTSAPPSPAIASRSSADSSAKVALAYVVVAAPPLFSRVATRFVHDVPSHRPLTHHACPSTGAACGVSHVSEARNTASVRPPMSACTSLPRSSARPDRAATSAAAASSADNPARDQSTFTTTHDSAQRASAHFVSGWLKRRTRSPSGVTSVTR